MSEDSKVKLTGEIAYPRDHSTKIPSTQRPPLGILTSVQGSPKSPSVRRKITFLETNTTQQRANNCPPVINKAERKRRQSIIDLNFDTFI